jgi:hypothetical protein
MQASFNSSESRYLEQIRLLRSSHRALRSHIIAQRQRVQQLVEQSSMTVARTVANAADQASREGQQHGGKSLTNSPLQAVAMAAAKAASKVVAETAGMVEQELMGGAASPVYIRATEGRAPTGCRGDEAVFWTPASACRAQPATCGKGTMEYANGDKYTGEWKDGERTNMTEGTMKYACGNEYIGQFQDGLRQSQAGVSCSMVYLDRSCYNGQWFQGMRHTGSDDNGAAQYGQMTYKNGDIYDGEWENDKFSRKGKMSYFNGDSYTGFWNQGLREGEGSMTYVMPHGSKGEQGSDSNVFTGTFRNGERKDGDGLMTYGDGSKYTGQWIGEQRSGRGYYVDTAANNRNVYVGEWENDMKHGFGELQYVKDEMKFTGQRVPVRPALLQGPHHLRAWHSRAGELRWRVRYQRESLWLRQVHPQERRRLRGLLRERPPEDRLRSHG